MSRNRLSVQSQVCFPLSKIISAITNLPSLCQRRIGSLGSRAPASHIDNFDFLGALNAGEQGDYIFDLAIVAGAWGLGCPCSTHILIREVGNFGPGNGDRGRSD